MKNTNRYFTYYCLNYDCAIDFIQFKTYIRRETYETLAPDNILQNESIKCKLYLLTDLLKTPSYTSLTLLNVWSSLYIIHLIK